MTARQIVKILHTLGSIGLAGGLGAFMIAIAVGPEAGVGPEYAEMRQGLASMSKWLILPSMLVSLTSGLLAMVVHYPFSNMGWVWVKALLGLLVFEASLASIDRPAKDAATATAKFQQGEIDVATMMSLIDDKWVAWWILMGIFAANVVLAIWRPRFSRSKL